MAAKEDPGKHQQARTLALADELYTTKRRYLLAIATKNAPTQHDAEEALQDTFALFINHFDPSSDAPPLAWITLTLKRRCWATAKHQIPLQTNPAAATPHNHEPPTEELVQKNQKTAQIQTAFKNLKPQERRALSLLSLGYSYKEIASITGWTYTKVNRCITEGRAALRTSTT